MTDDNESTQRETPEIDPGTAQILATLSEIKSEIEAQGVSDTRLRHEEQWRSLSREFTYGPGMIQVALAIAAIAAALATQAVQFYHDMVWMLCALGAMAVAILGTVVMFGQIAGYLEGYPKGYLAAAPEEERIRLGRRFTIELAALRMITLAAGLLCTAILVWALSRVWPVALGPLR
jgi:hypothetical protein